MRNLNLKEALRFFINNSGLLKGIEDILFNESEEELKTFDYDPSQMMKMKEIIGFMKEIKQNLPLTDESLRKV